MSDFPNEELDRLRSELKPLIGLRIDWLSLPDIALKGFEPSQIAVIVNTLLDAILPQIELLAACDEDFELLKNIGLNKAPGILGERESYPDYIHVSGKRIELKGLYVDNPALALKRPPTKREHSARLKENVTMDVIQPEKDVLLIAAVRLEKIGNACSPVIVDIGVFPMVECIKARDERLYASGGKWFNNVPKVISNKGFDKLSNGFPLVDSDYEKDTNFGKLRRIPYAPLQEYLNKWTE
ncbi:MAG: hypothetical protein EOM90_04870 [Alphaproteobacteria bacterium]|nr:hypothetical protein [Alphaproteobacteria bacterium]